MHRTMCGQAHKVGLIHTWAMHTGLEPLNVRTRYETDTQMMSRELFPYNSHGKGKKDLRVLWSVTKITLFAPIEDGFPI